MTQEGVNAVYQMRGLGTAPKLPENMVGATRQATRGGARFYGADGKSINGADDFLHSFNSQAVDPFREYTVGNYLGMAGLLAGGIGAGTAIAAGAGASGAGATGSGLGIFSNGGAAGLAGVGGGNAGALAAAGGITGGAGTGFLGSLGGGAGLLGANSIKNAGRLGSLLGNGGGGGGGAASGGGGDVTLPYMGLGSNYGQPTQQPQQPQQPQAGMMGSQVPNMLPSMNQPLQSFNRKPYQFSGSTIWI